MKWLDNPSCWVFDDGRVAVPSKQGIHYLNMVPDRLGYLRVSIHRKPYRAHRLVAIAFVKNPENKPSVDHINRVRDDNRASNLRWATQREQVLNSSKVIDELVKYGVRRSDDSRTYIRRYQREYRKTHREELNAKRREYRKIHREELNAKRRTRRAARKAAPPPTPASSQEP